MEMGKNDFYISCKAENCWELDQKILTSEHIITLRAEYERIWNKLLNKENFTFIRCADGEYGLMTGKQIHAQEGWHAPLGITELGKKLQSTLLYIDPRITYGISCPCCDFEAYSWYLDHIPNNNISFSNIFINANFERFKHDFSNLERDAVLITNYAGKGKKFGKLNIIKHYFVDDNCVSFWENKAENLIRNIIDEIGDRKNLLYVISAGPLAQIFIMELFKNNPDNCYIDFGSSLDFAIHNKITRPFMLKGSSFSTRNCWMYPKEHFKHNFDVVLTSYKRPETLKKQIEAVRNQTVKPKHIYLFKDGIESYYQISLDNEILKEFDDVYIADRNLGVWGRFEYALEAAKTEYVCIFDDDTIPGRRWFENCIMHMLQKDAVYGTNGILLEDIEGYPTEKMINIGWHSANDQTLEVDFVGHSWFIKTAFLKDMLARKYKDEFKYVGEDMCLSFSCKEKGIYTYVPHHPFAVPELWGSLPKYAFKYGISDIAISANSANFFDMKKALKEMRKDGWKLLVDEKPEYINKVKEEIVNNLEIKKKEQQIKNDIASFLHLEGRLYLYGAGKFGKIIGEYLKDAGWHIDGFVVTEKNEESVSVAGWNIPLIDIKQFITIKKTAKIILSLGEFYHNEVRKNIPENVQVFPYDNSAYSIQDIIDVIRLMSI